MSVRWYCRVGEDTGRGAQGPLIINPYTGIPVSAEHLLPLVGTHRQGRRHPKGLWIRDLRAGAATEGGKAGPRLTTWPSRLVTATSTTAEVYDRERLEAHRRVARARVAYRDNNGEGT